MGSPHPALSPREKETSARSARSHLAIGIGRTSTLWLRAPRMLEAGPGVLASQAW
jgi:hypothetical protein